eukprot:594278-Amphidinium_carterae.1
MANLPTDAAEVDLAQAPAMPPPGEQMEAPPLSDGPVPGDLGSAFPASGGPPLDFAAMNAQHRKVAGTWLRTQPLSSIMACKLLLTPLTDLLSAYIVRSGKDWEVQERGKLAQALSQGQSYRRTSSLLEYVKLTAEKECFGKLEELREQCKWVFLPRQSWTLDFQTVLFLALSRAGCSLQELLVAPAKKCPFKLLQLLSEGAAAVPGISALPECMLDEFSAQHLAMFPGQQLLSEDSIAILEAFHLSSSPDIVSVEWGHGRIHRLIKKSSVQTVAPTVAFVSAQWIMQRHHLRYQVASRSSSKETVDELAEPETESFAAEPASKKHKGGGGTCRAFISLQTRGQKGKPDMKQLAKDYATAKEQKTQLFLEAQEVGNAATERHKLTGKPSFGPPSRDVLLSKKKHQLAKLQDLAGSSSLVLGSSVVVDPDNPDLLKLLDDTSEHMSKVRRATLQHNKEKREEKEELVTTLEAYCTAQQESTLEKAFDVMPGLLSLSQHLHFAPHHALKTFDVVHHIENE